MNPERPQALLVALRVIDALESMGVRYHIGGSYASSIHGIPRQTQDIDLVADLTPDSAFALAQQLSGDFYADADSARQAAREGRSFNLIHLESGIKVDIFVLGRAPFDLEEFRRHRPQPMQIEPQHTVVLGAALDALPMLRVGASLAAAVEDNHIANAGVKATRVTLSAQAAF